MVVVVVVLVLDSVPTVPGSIVVPTFSVCACTIPAKATNNNALNAFITTFMAFNL